MFREIKYLVQKHLGITAVYNSIMFSQLIQDSLWLKNKSFALGDLGWAMDSLALHNLFRILNDVKPKNILEFGLGQSSKMVYQYAQHYKTNALTIEHDKDWIAYFTASYPQMDFNIQQMDLETIKINGAETISYKQAELIDSGEVELMIVDGPIGQKRYSRPQILNFIPQKLAKNFCIFVHDSERFGEQETIKLFCEKLKQNNVEYLKRDYTLSTKWHTIVCSPSWKFLTTFS